MPRMLMKDLIWFMPSLSQASFFFTLRAEPFLSSWLGRRKGASAWITSNLWSHRSSNIWTCQSRYLSSNRFFFFECVHPFIDKPMVITDPTVASTRLLLQPGLESISSQHAAHAPQNLHRFMQSLSRAVHQNRASERTSAGTKAASDRASAHT